MCGERIQEEGKLLTREPMSTGTVMQAAGITADWTPFLREHAVRAPKNGGCGRSEGRHRSGGWVKS